MCHVSLVRYEHVVNIYMPDFKKKRKEKERLLDFINCLRSDKRLRRYRV